MPVPRTFYDALIVLFCVVYALGQGGGGMARPPDPNTLNVRRVAGGAAGVALFAFVMISAAHDLHGFGRLAQFFMQLQLPPSFLLGTALLLLALLLVISLGRFVIGWRGPFPPRRSMTGGQVLWLVAAAGVWLWGGLFLDERTSWLDAWARRWNFGLTALLLVVCVYVAASMAVMLRNPAGAITRVQQDIAAGEFQWDAPRRRKWWQRKR